MSASRYRKRPVVIDAEQFYGANGQALADWCGGIYDDAEEAPTVIISTLEGTMTASLGDWIIKGVQGEFYPCKPDIFEATYEAEEAPLAQPRVTVTMSGGPWDGQTTEVERVIGPIFLVGHYIGEHYWLDVNSDPPTYFWAKEGNDG